MDFLNIDSLKGKQFLFNLWLDNIEYINLRTHKSYKEIALKAAASIW
jgi:hypothetical protein